MSTLAQTARDLKRQEASDLNPSNHFLLHLSHIKSQRRLSDKVMSKGNNFSGPSLASSNWPKAVRTGWILK